MQEFLELLKFFDIDAVMVLTAKLATLVGSFRLIMKPVTSFWINKISPYVDIRPKEKLLINPVYKAVTYVIDWALSIKAPQEKK